MNRLARRFGLDKPESIIISVVRLVLIIALAYFLFIYAQNLIVKGAHAPSGQWAEAVLFTTIALSATWVFDLLEKKKNIRTPRAISFVSVLFIFGSLFMGGVVRFYDSIWWWDDMLHLLSGVIIGLIGLLLFSRLNARTSMDISPVFVGLFVVTFAVTVGVVWEIYEFTLDAMIASNSQRWVSVLSSPVIGRGYQGPGLRDTMSDLITDFLGALIAGSYVVYLYSRNKKGVINIMGQTFGDKPDTIKSETVSKVREK